MDNEFENTEVSVEEQENGKELFNDNVFYNESFSVDQKINIPQPLTEDEKSDKKGLKLFCFIIAASIILSSFATGAFLLGKSQSVDREIFDKPENIEYGDSVSVYKSVSGSVVGIYVYNRDKKKYETSGLVYSSDGYVVVADSVLASVPAAKFKVVAPDGVEYTASFVGGDKRSDVAVLKINENVNLKPAVFGNSAEISIGDRVYSVGRANGYDNAATLSDGIVSGIDVRVTNGITSYSAKRIQSTTALNPGDFGGALANEYGQIIGMLSTKIVSTGYEQISYSVPSVEVKNIAEQIINNGKVADRARIGITYIAKNAADVEMEGLTAAGLLVASVDSESELYEKLKSGDIITEINGKRITKDDEVLDLVESSKVGDRITIRVVNTNGAEKEYTAKLLSYKSESSYSDLPVTDKSPDNQEPNQRY